MAELNVPTGKKGRSSKSGKLPVKVDLTAMVDLAFLLITFFMLTTSLAKPRVMPLVMPADAPPGPVSDKCTMTIDLGKNNKVLWYMGMADKPLSTPKVIGYGKELQNAIAEQGKQVLASTGKGLIVLIKPADHSVYANLVDALDIVNILNVPTYTIAAVLPKDAELLKQSGIY
jgi:biopolymer transport protein ExbD